MTLTALDHVQIAVSEGSEEACRSFYLGLLGLSEIEKPGGLRGRGGFWTRGPGFELHVGIDPDFHPSTKGHPAFRTRALDALSNRLASAGYAVRPDGAIEGRRRFFTDDPAGNRIEFIEERDET